MTIRFADEYIDRLFAEKDMSSLHHLVSVVSQERQLPEEFWLFCRIYEWAPCRSGVWQYYEGLPEAKFNRIAGDLDRFGFSEIAEKYRFGMRTWDGPDLAKPIDDWLDSQYEQIHAVIFELIEPLRDQLRSAR